MLNYEKHTEMSQAFRRYLATLKLTNKGYSMRTFRKTFISTASETIELSAVSRLVGHSDIRTTAKYYNKVDEKQQEKELEKFIGIEGAK